jgi:putative hydrolase of the HAD superfamily
VSRTVAVFFDVDFTLIFPGPRFQGVGYEQTCAKYDVAIDRSRFDAAVAGAADLLHSGDHLHDPQLFVNYTRRIIELMGGAGPDLDAIAREIYDDWATHHHFSLYDDVAETLRQLQARDVRVGLISNANRSLDTFQSHFALHGLIAGWVSSSDHGYMKPHPSIFHAALALLDVTADEAVMVGDSLAHDVRGAEQAGMRGILLDRAGTVPVSSEVTVIRSLADLPALLDEYGAPGTGRAARRR